MRPILIIAALIAFIGLAAIAQQITAPSSLYQNDFQNVMPGTLPEDFKVLSGEFAVEAEGDNRFLELSVGHVNSFGVLFGPEHGAPMAMQARVRSSLTGKRFPEFGIGLGGVGGYRLWLMPIVQEIQIRQGDSTLARAPFTWTSGTWTSMRLELNQAGDGRWQIGGKAWPQGATEPAEWTIRHEATAAPTAGRAVLWATPYSEKPIQFDDVRIEAR